LVPQKVLTAGRSSWIVGFVRRFGQASVSERIQRWSPRSHAYRGKHDEIGDHHQADGDEQDGKAFVSMRTS
jgi:hypothetical protein